MHAHRTAECMASLTEAKFLCYLGRPPNVPGNEKSGGIPLDNPHFTMWLHLSMLVDFETPLINPACKPRGAIYGEIIDINSLPICHPPECDLRTVCATLESSATLFTMHNSALKLIGNHIALLNAKVHCITSQIALLHEHKRMGYIMVDKIW